MDDQPGRAFQEKTAYRRYAMEDYQLDWRNKPPVYKSYPHAPVVELPSPAPHPGPGAVSDFWMCVARRRSVRDFGPDPLTLIDLSRLLWASAGITASFLTPRGQHFFRAVPAAGALYPIETYVVANNVSGLEPGLYHYRPTGLDILDRPLLEGGHALESLRRADLRTDLAAAALDQPMCAEAAAAFIWTAVFARSEWKYRDRAYRYIYLDAGHVAAQLSLAVVALGLRSCPIAAFYDDEVDALLGIDGQTEGALYMTVVGRPDRPA